MSDINIREAMCTRGVLASLSLSVWQGNKLDHTLSDAQSKAVNASKVGAIRVHKTLLSDPRIRVPQRIAGEARRRHAEMTLPWHYDGVGLLPAVSILEYTQAMDTLKVNFWEAVADIEDHYGDMIQEAINDLGEAFNVSDYPHASQLRNKYAWSSKFERLPTTGVEDLRLEVPDEVVDAIASNINTEHESVVKEVINRMNTVVSAVVDRLQALSEDSSARLFTSTFDKLADLPRSMRALNVTGNDEIDAICSKIEDLVLTAEEARKDPAIAENSLVGLERIQNRLKFF